MSIREELLKFKNSSQKKNNLVTEQTAFLKVPEVYPDKMDYRKPIPNPDILPDCFTKLVKSTTNMVSFNTHTLTNGFQKRVDGVDMIFDPNSPSDELGITIMKDGKPFCFIKK